MTLVSLELQRIMRRRGSFFGATGVGIAVGLLALLAAWGDQTESVWTQAFGIPIVFGATIIGALAGSYDTAQGTMRYLVLTGQPRTKLILLRLPALLAAIALFATPAALITLGAMAGDGQSAEAIARVLGGNLAGAFVWGTVSMAIGTMLRSNGAGIGVALTLFLAGSILTQVVRTEVSEAAGNYLLPYASFVVMAVGHANPGEEPIAIGLAAAAIATLAWVAAFLTAAVVRAQRDEY
ncbi:MAG: hypothetical protein Q7T55_23435 [Solirubrobacteraceae bacterium]|nr:hypothetical protein [Solirubrobacteraceae bacterium]